jgi:hypothetical protein
MPWTSGFFKEPGWDKPENIDRSVDHFIAATIAYGHIGWLVEEIHGIERTCRSYYMLQQLQKRYAMCKPAKIEYINSNGKTYTPSQAIASGIIGDSVLHVVYENGLNVYVNQSERDWKYDSRTLLPQWGWAAFGPDRAFREFSGLFEDHRIDYVYSDDYEYLDGKGYLVSYNGLSARGSIAVRRRENLVEVIDIYGNNEIRLRLDWRARCTAYDANGNLLGEVSVTQLPGNIARIKTVDKARRYVFRPEAAVEAN